MGGETLCLIKIVCYQKFLKVQREQERTGVGNSL
jgi:hypothetical protein